MESQIDECEGDPPAVDAIFDLLGHCHRRRLLACLRATEGSLPLARIAAEIATWDDDRSPEFVDEGEIQRVRSMLYHGHVPKLREHDVVEFDPGRDEVSLQGRVEYLFPYLDEAVDREPDL